jgi:hypothetical protein
MAHENRPQVLDLRSVFGLEARVTAPSEATGGAYVEMECLLQPGGESGIHYHPGQEESFEVLEGTLELFRDGTWHKASAGERFVIPAAGEGEELTPSMKVRRAAIEAKYLGLLDSMYDVRVPGAGTDVRPAAMGQLHTLRTPSYSASAPALGGEEVAAPAGGDDGDRVAELEDERDALRSQVDEQQEQIEALEEQLALIVQ